MWLDDRSSADHGWEGRFAGGLLQPDVQAPGDVVARSGATESARYNVYRNNVTVSLIDCLASIYPAVQRITGVEFFRAMARFHVRATPPTSPLLFRYGRDFPAFIETYEYARQMPWLADVARIERAWLDAYHAADLPALPVEVFAQIEPAELGELRFTVHPATRIVHSAYPALSIFAANRTDGPAAPVCSDESESALVTRPEFEVIVSHLPPGGSAFLRTLISGEPLAPAAAAAFAESDAFDLQANLAGMISTGVFTAIQP